MMMLACLPPQMSESENYGVNCEWYFCRRFVFNWAIQLLDLFSHCVLWVIFRNPVEMQGRGQDRMIDLHGLHVSEAIHLLKHELSVLRSTARATEQRLQVYICVGTGHHTKGSRTPVRLPIAVQRYLLEEEGLDYSEPQPGLLRVVIYWAKDMTVWGIGVFDNHQNPWSHSLHNHSCICTWEKVEESSQTCEKKEKEKNGKEWRKKGWEIRERERSKTNEVYH